MRIVKKKLPKSKGTYIIISRIGRPITINIGRLGPIYFGDGLYAYVGSAFGPGGLRARILRHLKKQKKKFWHIDYLLDHAHIEYIIIIESNKKLECIVAHEISKQFKYIKDFGASDCNCPSHLFIIDDKEKLLRILDRLRIRYVVYRINNTNENASESREKWGHQKMSL